MLHNRWIVLISSNTYFPFNMLFLCGFYSSLLSSRCQSYLLAGENSFWILVAIPSSDLWAKNIYSKPYHVFSCLYSLLPEMLKIKEAQNKNASSFLIFLESDPRHIFGSYILGFVLFHFMWSINKSLQIPNTGLGFCILGSPGSHSWLSLPVLLSLSASPTSSASIIFT